MSDSFTLADSASLDDLQVFLARAARIEEGSVRLIAGSGVLAVYAAVFYPIGLLDESPTVLGLRTFSLPEKETFDVVVPVGSLLQRIANRKSEVTDVAAPVSVTLPMQVSMAVGLVSVTDSPAVLQATSVMSLSSVGDAMPAHVSTSPGVTSPAPPTSDHACVGSSAMPVTRTRCSASFHVPASASGSGAE